MEEHYRILGLRPGCSDEELKKAFRARIKVHHPDHAKNPEQAETARRIIEAYHAILEIKESGGETSQSEFVYEDDPRMRPQPQGWVHQAGRQYARHMFERVFRDKFEQVFGFRSDMGMHWDDENFDAASRRQSQKVPGSSRPAPAGPTAHGQRQGAGGHGADSSTQRSQQRGPASSRPADRLSEGLERAENALRDTVHRFQKRGGRSKREWCREYLGQLAQVQILFRDVIVREPRSESHARSRLNQVRELMGVIRAMV